MEIAPSSLPPSSQAQSPNHLVPRHKSFPLQARKPRIPPSTGKEIFKCNQRIFLCFIYFFPGEIHLSEVFDVFFCSSVRPHRCTEAEWSQPAKLNIFSLFGVDTDDTYAWSPSGWTRMTHAWSPRASLIATLASFKLCKLGCEKRVPGSPFLPDWTRRGAPDGRPLTCGSLAPTSCRNPAQLSPDPASLRSFQLHGASGRRAKPCSVCLQSYGRKFELAFYLCSIHLELCELRQLTRHL